MKKSDINLSIFLDENAVPEAIQWNASDSGISGVQSAKAMMLALWDEKEKNTLRIDLWTKEMNTDEMKNFFYQTIMTMADTFERATGEDKMSKEMREFGMDFGEKMELIRRNSNN